MSMHSTVACAYLAESFKACSHCLFHLCKKLLRLFHLVTLPNAPGWWLLLLSGCEDSETELDSLFGTLVEHVRILLKF
jgi:hypothetical protein